MRVLLLRVDGKSRGRAINPSFEPRHTTPASYLRLEEQFKKEGRLIQAGRGGWGRLQKEQNHINLTIRPSFIIAYRRIGQLPSRAEISSLALEIVCRLQGNDARGLSRGVW